MARIVAAGFVHEPMSQAIGLDADELYAFVSRFIPEFTTQGLSVIAVPEEAPSQMAGVFLNREFKALLPPDILDEFPRFRPIFHALGTVARLYEAQIPDLRCGQAVDLWMIAVDPGGRFPRRGIGRNLFRASIEAASAAGFERCVTECTSVYSQRCAVANAFQERVSILYEDLRFEGHPVFAAIAAPHIRVALYERTLRTNIKS